MKSILATLVFLIGANSFACDQILGSWSCHGDQAGDTTVTYTKTSSGLQAETTDNKSDSTILVLDGTQRTLSKPEVSMKYTASLSCDNNGSAQANIQGQVIAKNGVQRTMVMKSLIRISGNQLTTDSNVTVDGKAQSTHSTCTKL